MDEWIRMADGTMVTDAYVVKLDGSIAVYAYSVGTVREAWEVFGDPAKTREMHSSQYGDEADWTGYTEVTAMQAIGGGVTVCLTQQDNGGGDNVPGE